MPMMQKGFALMSNRMPKLLSPRWHAIADCLALGGLALMGVLLLSRNKRAAMGAFSCAGAGALNALLTDYPGGAVKAISFPTHGKIDFGIATACSAVPNFLCFEDDQAARYFRIMGLSITAIASLTDFEQPADRPKRIRRIV